MKSADTDRYAKEKNEKKTETFQRNIFGYLFHFAGKANLNVNVVRALSFFSSIWNVVANLTTTLPQINT